MRKILQHIPNALTCLNLFFGCIAVWLAFQGNFTGMLLAVAASAAFDFLDGLAARSLNAYSPLGKELDSLADIISFGLVPGAAVFFMLSQADCNYYLRFVGFIIPVFSALRLAKFNLDERQSSSFIGFPTPANGIFWCGLAYAYSAFFIQQPILLVTLALLFSLLLVSEIPMFSLKLKGFSWSNSSVQYVFVLGCIVLLVLFRLNSIPYFIVWYIVLSVFLFVVKRKNKSKNF